MNYTKIDLNNWSRAELFNMYIENMRIVMSLTVETDVTQLIRFTKKNSLKFYPCMVWIVSKIVNCHDEFKYGWDSSGNLIRWNCVFPSYVNFSKEDESFTKLVTPFSEDIFSFYSDVINDREKYRKVRGIAKISRQISSMYPVCHGYTTAILTSTSLTRENSLLR